ncbi:putative FAD-dependent pyridine nucleotide-disulfide oxidoreductase (sulfide:quinone oxidoreductase-like) [Nitrososphaera viennensis EN76]|nr:putative FAD-dependent pyridine nucleotide-disulfide oxidoreductase (sulfide:quinone oxidoreductase-like) [Nitrososphaera viennensis EN76]
MLKGFYRHSPPVCCYIHMGKRIVILGAGFGGLACANALRKGLSQDHRVIVVDRKKSFMMGLVNLWILAGSRRPDEPQTPLAGLNARGIEYLNDEAIKIDIAAKKVQARGHGWIDYDYLVVALGSELAPEKIEGFAGRGYNLYDAEQVQPLREKLLALRQGRVAISVMGMPYKCPPAPYEAAMIISDILEKNGTRKNVQVDMYVPAPIALPVVGPQVSREIVDMIARYGIRFHPDCKPKIVRDGEVEFESGEKAAYDVLAGIPPHRSPDVIKTSGLATSATGEWVPVDRLTLRTGHPGVFAIGDVAEVKSGTVTVPKAGIFAEGQAKVVAQEIIDEISGRPASTAAYNGQGFCFVEVGNSMAGFVEADFYHEGGPAVRLEPPSAESYEKKHDFERSRIKEWLL